MTYLIIAVVLGPLVVSLFARGKFQATYDDSRKVKGAPTLTGAGVARQILEASGIEDVQIVEHWGLFPDYYDPAQKRLRLSRPHFRGSNAAAYGVAAHEAGHALQHRVRFAPLNARISAIKASQYLSPLIFVVGISMVVVRPTLGLIMMFSSWALLLVYNLSTLPVEADATQRANEVLRRLKLFRNRDEEKATYKMMRAAGLMYVSGFLNTVRWLLSCIGMGGKG